MLQRRTHVLLSAACFAVLVLLHLDFWRPPRPVVWFGLVPEELGWRLAWLALAFAYLTHFCRCVWRTEPGE